MFCIEHGWTIASVFCVHYIYMHYKHIASERLYFEHLQCLFTVEWQCIFFKRCDASNRSIVRPFSTHTLNSMHTYYVDVSWVIGWMNFFQTWIPFSYKKIHENDSKKPNRVNAFHTFFVRATYLSEHGGFFLSSNVFFRFWLLQTQTMRLGNIQWYRKIIHK